MESISKKKTKLGDTYKQREHDFMNSLNNLFDIASQDALQIMTIEVDKQFLIQQRQKGRPGSMIGVDRKLMALEKSKKIKAQKPESTSTSTPVIECI